MKRLGRILVLILAAASASAAEPFTHISVFLQDSSLSTRVSGGEFLDYYDRLTAEAEAIVAELDDQTPRFGSIVFAVRPDGSRKLWVDLYPAPTSEIDRAMTSRLEAVRPCRVVGGTVVAAINMTFWHSRDLALKPMPREWRDVTEKAREIEVTEFVDSIWPPLATPNTSLERTRE